MIDFTTMTDEQVDTLLQGVFAESQRRRVQREAPAQAERIARDFLAAAGRVPGDPWVAPTGAHDAFPAGWWVTHNGREWDSLVPGNVWEPGVSGWRERVPEGSAPAWVQPTGAHDAHAKGDRVTHAGHVWVSDFDGNVWEPGVHGWTRED